MWKFALAHMPYVLAGVPVAVEVWVLAMAAGFVFGLVLAAARLYGDRLSYSLATFYIEVFRGTPMIVQLLIVYLGLPSVGLTFSPFVATVITMGLNTAAYQAEYFRGSIQSVSRGQLLAARAHGMSGYKAFVHVVLPQALRRVIPQWSNEAILEFKFTSIAYTIGLTEITARASEVGSDTYKYFWAFLLTGIVYLVMTNFIAELLEWLQRVTAVPGVTFTGSKGRKGLTT
ncbi:MAG TPA: amino acid ABC transporter permease [Gammaproteobacteria bacterium]|nr:amino acid ABC transporter permease [Gammaproteobacteria bacterium]